MARSLRRIRGALLRLALRRVPALVIGGVLVGMAMLVRGSNVLGMPWVADGVAMVLAATGLALVLAGLSGRRPDWIDPERH